MIENSYREKISTFVERGYKILLVMGILLFLLLVSGIIKYHGYYTEVNLLGASYRAIISMLFITIPLFFLSRKKVNLGDQLIKNMLFLFGHSLLLILFLSLCTGPLYYVVRLFYSVRTGIYDEWLPTPAFYRSDLAPFLTCPGLKVPPYELPHLPIELFIFLFIILSLALDFIHIIAHTYYYAKIKKNVWPLLAVGISLLLGTVLIAIFIRLFELAGNALWR